MTTKQNVKPTKATRNRRTPRNIICSAIKVEYNDKHFFLSAMPGKDLANCAKVSRADEDIDKGYQRLLKSTRARSIAEYFNQGNMIPGSIILSAQPEAQIRYDDTRGVISFLPVPGAFLVIDGQHRLYGAHEATVDVTLPVCIFEGLDLEQEVQYFLDVNGNQRGVPRTLQLEIIKFSAPEESDDMLRVNLFRELNTNPDSPLCNKMSATKSVVGKLSHVPFKAAIEPILRIPMFREADHDKKTQLLMNFLNAVESVLVDSMGSTSKLTNAAFFQALFFGFEAMMNHTLRVHGDLKEDSFRQTVAPLANIDWDVHSGTNRAEIQKLSQHILSLVLAGDKLSDDIL